MKEYTVKGMALHQNTKLAFVVLEQTEGRYSLPLPVGSLEASSILIELEGASPPRPSAHDLLAHFFLRHHFKVTRVVISHIDEEFSSAVVHYKRGPRKYSMEAVPADAIAIALRLSVPIYLTDDAAARAQNKAYVEAVFEPDNPAYLYVEPKSEGLFEEEMAYAHSK